MWWNNQPNECVLLFPPYWLLPFLLSRLACLFLSGKLEGSFIRAQELLSITNGGYSDKDINDAERDLIEVCHTSRSMRRAAFVISIIVISMIMQTLSFSIHVEHPQSIIISLLSSDWIRFAKDRQSTDGSMEQILLWNRTVIERSCYAAFLLQVHSSLLSFLSFDGSSVYFIFRRRRWSYPQPLCLLHWTPSQLPSPLLQTIVYRLSLISICAKNLVLKSSMTPGKTPGWCFPPSVDWLYKGDVYVIISNVVIVMIWYALFFGPWTSCHSRTR